MLNRNRDVKGTLEDVSIDLSAILDVLNGVYQYIEDIPTFNNNKPNVLDFWDTSTFAQNQLSTLFLLDSYVRRMIEDIERIIKDE